MYALRFVYVFFVLNKKIVPTGFDDVVVVVLFFCEKLCRYRSKTLLHFLSVNNKLISLSVAEQHLHIVDAIFSLVPPLFSTVLGEITFFCRKSTTCIGIGKTPTPTTTSTI